MRAVGWVFVGAVAACGPERLAPSAGPEGGDDAEARYVDGTPEADLVLRAANEATLAELDDDVPLKRRVALNIVDGRAGPDGVDGTGDDTPYATIAALDAVPKVTKAVLDALYAYGAATWGAPPPCPVYADPTVLPGGDGSIGDPFPSIGYAIAFRDPTCAEVRLVPGTYHENVDFGGADVNVVSLDGPATTRIASATGGNLVSFGAGSDGSLSGVSLDCGGGTWSRGVYAVGANPRLSDLVISGCRVAAPGVPPVPCGGGAYFDQSGGSLVDSEIRNSSDAGVCLHASTTEIRGSWFEGNTHLDPGYLTGAAIDVRSGAPRLIGNTFVGNPGGTYKYTVVLESSDATVASNLFVDNTSGGVVFLSYDRSLVANNTLVGNAGIGLYASVSLGATIANDLIVDQAGYGVYTYFTVASFVDNDVFGATTAYGGTMPNQTGLNGNLSVDPQFVSATDFGLAWGSPCIDAGTDLFAEGVTEDLVGAPRPGGLGFDLGAYESW
ncbi:MAG: right-handed parallel beta-helix repeat-containing protein [Myxococcota bacterium]